MKNTFITVDDTNIMQKKKKNIHARTGDIPAKYSGKSQIRNMPYFCEIGHF